MFSSNIKRLAQQEMKKLKVKKNSEHHTYIDGYSSDEDSDLPEEDRDLNETKEFIDDKIALASAALGIMDEIEDYYKDFKTYADQSVLYNKIDDSVTTDDILFNCLKNEVQVELFTYDPLGRYSSQLQTDINQIPFMQQINEQIIDQASQEKEVIGKVKQKILETYVFEKFESEINYCYNPYSQKLTIKLSESFLQLADLSYKQSEYKSNEVLKVFQKIISSVVKKFEEYFTYTSSYPQQNISTNINFEYIKFCLGRNLRLVSNLIYLRKMIPQSIIYSLGFEKIFETNTQMINLFQDPQQRAFYFAKHLLQIPLDLISISDSIKQKVIQVSLTLDNEMQSVNEVVILFNYHINQIYFIQNNKKQILNLSQSEVEKLQEIQDHLKQYQS